MLSQPELSNVTFCKKIYHARCFLLCFLLITSFHHVEHFSWIQPFPSLSTSSILWTLTLARVSQIAAWLWCNKSLQVFLFIYKRTCKQVSLFLRSLPQFCFAKTFNLLNDGVFFIFNDSNCTPWTSSAKPCNRIIMSLLHNISHEKRFTLSFCVQIVMHFLLFLLSVVCECAKITRDWNVEDIVQQKKRKRLKETSEIMYGSIMFLTLTWLSRSSGGKLLFSGC